MVRSYAAYKAVQCGAVQCNFDTPGLSALSPAAPPPELDEARELYKNIENIDIACFSAWSRHPSSAKLGFTFHRVRWIRKTYIRLEVVQQAST
jgi:hypothetical protein